MVSDGTVRGLIVAARAYMDAFGEGRPLCPPGTCARCDVERMLSSALNVAEAELQASAARHSASAALYGDGEGLK